MSRLQRGSGCRKASVILVATLGFFLLSSADVLATNVIFTIQSNISSENWSGTDNTYGPYSPQFPGSNSTPVSGNFVVSFDPTTDTPQSLQLVANFNDPNNNNGYFQLQTNNQSYAPFSAPANLGLQSGPGNFAIRNLVYNFSSPAITASNTTGLTSTFTASTTSFKVTSGGIDSTTVNGTASSSYVGASDVLGASAHWTLSESAAGSGDWSLNFSGPYAYTYNTGVTSGTLVATGNITSTAHYVAGNVTQAPNLNTSTGNVVTVPTPTTSPVEAQVLGGASTPGGITADFPPTITPGTITVQQVPGITSLTQAAVDAGQSNPVFALSTSDAAIGAPQIWNVDFAGNLNGGSATLKFNYDPSLLPPGTDQSQLVIWHFNHNTNTWEHTGAGDVNIADHTITYTTDSFSPFSLGTLTVPEPSTFVLGGGGLLALAWVGWRRRKGAGMARG